MDYQEFQNLKNFRPIARDEIVLDCDDRGNGDFALRQIGMAMSAVSYRLEIWKAAGQKSYHIHIKDIPHITELPKEQNRLYKELLIKKYINKVIEILGYKPQYFDRVDFSLCIPDHLIAKENNLHYKYKTKKELLAAINQDYKNFCEQDIYQQVLNYKPESRLLKNENIETKTLSQKIAQKISILAIADKFGLKPFGKPTRICPFHIDKNPSLSLNNSRGLYHCFGCQSSGNIIKFYAMLKKLNPDFRI